MISILLVVVQPIIIGGRRWYLCQGLNNLYFSIIVNPRDLEKLIPWTMNQVGDNVYDNVESGQLLVAIDPSQPKEPLYVPPLTYIDEVVPQTGYTDSKWFSDMIYVDFDLHFLQHRKRSLSSLPPRQNLPHRSIGRRAGPMQGGWFCVRGISKDGTPGVFSHPVYISASDEV